MYGVDVVGLPAMPAAYFRRLFLHGTEASLPTNPSRGVSEMKSEISYIVTATKPS